MKDVTGVVIAEVTRGGRVESQHRAALVLLDSDGSLAWAAGDPRLPVLPRSALKPLQAMGMLTAGLRLPGELLALVSASHVGAPEHVDLVRRLLESFGLDGTALRNTPALPLGPEYAHAVLRAGGGPRADYAPCSGKHAGMVATCLAAGWPADRYEQHRHPLQRHLRTAIEEFSAVRLAGDLEDGCGAPTHAMSLIALARALRLMTLADPASAPGTVADAVRAWPEIAGGRERAVTRAMGSVPGLLAKDGAEGVLAMALPDGRAAAVKILDGADRAIEPALCAVLEAWSIRGLEPSPGEPGSPAVGRTGVIRHRPLPF